MTNNNTLSTADFFLSELERSNQMRKRWAYQDIWFMAARRSGEYYDTWKDLRETNPEEAEKAFERGKALHELTELINKEMIKIPEPPVQLELELGQLQVLDGGLE